MDSDDSRLINAALISFAAQLRRASTRRHWSGDDHRDIRQGFRAEARRCTELATMLRTGKLVITDA